MPLQSEIVQRLSADNSQFRSVMNQSEAVADRAGKSILKKLDIKAGAVAVAAAVGFSITSIAEGLARMITGVSKETEDALKEMATISETYTARNVAEMRSKTSLQNQYNLALLDEEQIKRRIASNRGNTPQDQVQFYKDGIALLDKQKEIKDLISDLDKQSADALKDAREEADKITKITLDRFDVEEAAFQAKKKNENALKDQKNQEIRDRAVWWSQEKRRIAEETKRREELQALVRGTLVAVTDQTGKEVVISAEKIKQLNAVRSANEAQGKMNLLLGDTIILMGKAYGTSRDPNDLANASDEALQDLIAKNRKEIAVIEAGKGRGLTAGADAATGYLAQGIVQNRLQTDIQRALFNLDLRNNTRRDLSEGGASRARENFGGDSLMFDDFVQRFASNASAQEKIASGLDRLNEHLSRGISAVHLGNMPDA